VEETYVYLSVKLYLKSGQTKDSIQEVVQDMDYSFVHPSIIMHEIIDIIDTQLPEQPTRPAFDLNADDPRRPFVAVPISNVSPEDIGGMPGLIDPFDLTPFDGE